MSAFRLGLVALLIVGLGLTGAAIIVAVNKADAARRAAILNAI